MNKRCANDLAKSGSCDSKDLEEDKAILDRIISGPKLEAD